MSNILTGPCPTKPHLHTMSIAQEISFAAVISACEKAQYLEAGLVREKRSTAKLLTFGGAGVCQPGS